MKKSVTFGLSFLSGILLWAAWPVSPFTFLIFVAFVPLLHLADVVEKKRRFFLLTYIALLTWNVITTWWIYKSSDIGSIAAFTANSLVMYLPWWGYRIFKRRYGRQMGYLALVLFWMMFEYIHLNWQLSWPWLTLGNVFATHPNWVQWYEYTGTSGGTLWVLLANVLLFEVLRAVANNHFTAKKLVWPVVVIVLPLLLSFPLIPAEKTNTQKANVVIVQSNIDPYGKFAMGATGPQVQQFLRSTASAIDTNTRLVIWPETALTGSGAFEDALAGYYGYQPVFNLMQAHPNITLLTGVELLKSYGQQKATRTAFMYGNVYADEFNAAVAIKKGVPLTFYHKSRLVPGVETLPAFLYFMAPVFEQFGGTTGGYATQAESAVFQQPGQPYIVAPVICYESIYGEYVSTFVQKGANIITIITNDGWWGNTSGRKQHLAYARLRAIETRRWVAQCANTGISAVINDRGDVMETSAGDEEAVLKYSIPTLTGITFYVQYGDILSKAALIIAALFLGWHLVSIFKSRYLTAK